MWTSLARPLGVLLAAGLIAACGGGASEPPVPPEPSGWITIDPVAEPATVCNEVYLSGTAFISPTWWHGPPGTAAEMTGVTVTWLNESSGQSGTTFQSVRLGTLLPLDDHTWSAKVPLVMGVNTIAVTATGLGGLPGTKRVSVAKTGASYTVKGKLGNFDGLGLGYLESGMGIELSGDRVVTGAVGSGAQAGEFQFSCLAPGSYVVTPGSAAFSFSFGPWSRAFTVVDADVTGLDMSAPAQPVSGQVTWAVSGAPSSETLLRIGGGSNAWSRLTDARGEYRFLVPDGAYAVVPSDPSCVRCPFTPARRDIAVQGAAVTGLDFTR